MKMDRKKNLSVAHHLVTELHSLAHTTKNNPAIRRSLHALYLGYGWCLKDLAITIILLLWVHS